MMLMHKKPSFSQSGFTLVEIAIVLVIIGLLLGGVLKGQSLIESAKVKALQKELNSIQIMVNSYQDKYKAIPGDDAAASTNVGGTNGSGSGLIDVASAASWTGTSAAATNADEPALFWNHVRLAGMATGVATSGQAKNAVGGLLGITSGTARPTTPANVPGTHAACSSNIPGRIAKQLDFAMDDGVATTGPVFAALQTGAATPVVAASAASTYVDASFYTVCQVF